MPSKQDVLEDIKLLVALDAKLQQIQNIELNFKVLNSKKLNKVSRQSVINHLNSLIVELGKLEVTNTLGVELMIGAIENGQNKQEDS